MSPRPVRNESAVEKGLTDCGKACLQAREESDVDGEACSSGVRCGGREGEAPLEVWRLGFCER